MADAENDVSASKKRIAGRQITKDNLEFDDDTSESEMGTFQKASEEVLATRRIVKVLRQQPVTTASSNPFAGIRLVSSAETNAKAVAQVESGLEESNSAKEKDGEDNTSKSGVLFDEPNGTEESNKHSDCNIGAKEATSNEIEIITAVEGESQSLETGTDVICDKNGADAKLWEKPDNKSTEEADGQAVEKPKEVCDEAQKEAGKMFGKEVEETKKGEVEETKKGEVEDKNMKEASGAASTFSSFRHLSSSQNAFTCLSGTGFGTSSFSFGSVKERSAFGSSSLVCSNNGTNSSPQVDFSGKDAFKTGADGGPSLQEVPVETGEENEKSVFTADATLYEYLDGSWKERGRGEIKVNASISGEKARLVMRSRGNYRLILNASLYPDMTLANMDKKGVTFSCINIAREERVGLTTCALKFKDSSFAEEFSGAVIEHKGKKTIALKTPENSPKDSDEQREDFV